VIDVINLIIFVIYPGVREPELRLHAVPINERLRSRFWQDDPV
jgi:hypothetical protein